MIVSERLEFSRTKIVDFSHREIPLTKKDLKRLRDRSLSFQTPPRSSKMEFTTPRYGPVLPRPRFARNTNCHAEYLIRKDQPKKKVGVGEC